MFSIVCVYNNEEVLTNWLLANLKLQTAKYQIILLDNSNLKFSSAADALNFGGSLAKGDYIMFVHQDVRLEGATWLRDAEKLMAALDNVGVAGIAGISVTIRDQKLNQRNLIKHGDPPRDWGTRINQPEIIQVLDEVLFIVPHVVFESYKFDKITCCGWHLYGVDYCLTVSRAGFDNYVLPLPVWHRSTGGGPSNRLGVLLNYGVLPKGYYCTLKKVLRKHRDQYTKIFTTCGIWNTKNSVFFQRSIKLVLLVKRYVIKFKVIPRRVFGGQ